MQQRKPFRWYYYDIIIADIEVFSDFKTHNSTTLIFSRYFIIFNMSYSVQVMNCTTHSMKQTMFYT